MLCKQILRSSSSVGANYTESIEARYLKDRSNKINIARKEVKETVFWLDLISLEFSTIDVTSEKSEAIEIAKILATIQRKIDNSLDS
jgi:four helix bundle protein